MDEERKQAPIGIFDSGVGGISVLQYLRKLMPHESFLYYADERNAPFGDKSEEEVKRFTEEAVTFLIDQHVKAIVIACHTASSCYSYDEKEIPVLGMILPTIRTLIKNGKGNNALILTTKRTYDSLVYQYSLENYPGKYTVYPCPTFAKLVEENRHHTMLGFAEVKSVLSEFSHEPYPIVVCACTHFPFLSSFLYAVIKSARIIIDGGEECALEMKSILKRKKWLSDRRKIGSITFLSSIDSKQFSRKAIPYLYM